MRELIRTLLTTAPAETRKLHAEHINPTYIEALGLLGYGRDFIRGEGVRLWDAEGREYLDFLASYGSLLLGHNHPGVRAALEETLAAGAPNFLQIAPNPLATALAAKLAKLAPGDLSISYFTSSGSEAVEGALKLARAATHRERFVAAERGFHGITFGALSVTGGEKHRAPFGALLPGVAFVPFGDAAAIERELKKRDVAAVILEPMQGEGGMRLPPDGYLADVARLCKRYGTLLILDEIQTGLGRTGKMFYCEHDHVEPDVLVLAKGLSGGLVPVSVYVTRPDIWRRAYGNLAKYDVHSSTFTGGPLACAAALATLEIIESENLLAKATELGAYLGDGLRKIAAEHPLIREVRGRGLLWGIELGKGSGEGMNAELVGQWLAVGLMDRGIVTQVGTQAPDVVRAEPALIVEREQLDRFLEMLKQTLLEHSTGAWSSVASAVGRVIKTKLFPQKGATAS